MILPLESRNGNNLSAYYRHKEYALGHYYIDSVI